MYRMKMFHGELSHFDIPPHPEPSIFSRRFLNGAEGSPLVHMSARLSEDATGIMKKVPFSICSRTKWKCTSMCFERSEIFGFDAMSIAALLSQNKIGVVTKVPVSSRRAV